MKSETVRKDGVTPEFAHPVGVANYVRTLPSLIDVETSICVALLHDVREDYDVSDAEIGELFGSGVATGVDLMTKKFRGVRRDDVALFEQMAFSPVASVVKPSDRINNQNSMVGVFTPNKLAEYIEETQTLFLPMIKKARARFPQQEPAYVNVQLMLESQVAFVNAVLGE